MKQFNIGDSPMAHLTPDELSGPSHTLLKKSLVIAVIAGAMVFTTATQAVSLKISGQVSRMVVMPDDAVGDEIQYQDIGWSGSRFRFTGSQELGNGMMAGFRWEMQGRDNSSGDTSGGDQVENNTKNFDFRYQDIWFSGDFGKVAIGKGDGAANGSTEVDLSGTALSSSSNYQDNWGKYRITAGQTWDSIFVMRDALSRTNRLRYDSPASGGFSLAFSLGQGSATEIGVKYSGGSNGTQIKAAAFVADTADSGGIGTDTDIFGGSVSYLMPSGFNVTLAFSDEDFTVGADRDAFSAKVGYKKGIHAYTLDIGDGSRGAEDADTFGLTWAAVLDKGIEVFATIRELDSSNVPGATSIDILAFGSRIKF